MANYKLVEFGEFAQITDKTFLREALGLTGSEISITNIAAGQGASYAHTHKQNEEVYLVFAGEGTFFMDGEEFPISTGSVLRVDPQGERAWKAGVNGLSFFCIQTKQSSLEQASRNDGAKGNSKASWM